MRPQLKTAAQMQAMREGGHMLAQVLQRVAAAMKPGITTNELDSIAAAEIKSLGGEAAFLGHQDFPKSICISVNDELVHGIPGPRELKEGDIVGLDFGVRHKELITDGAITVPLGKISSSAQRLLQVTQEALYIGIDKARAGNRVGDISSAIENHLKKAGLGIVRELAGHGVGHDLWEEPQIPNIGKPGTGPLLRAGMTVAIEPMASVGKPGIHIFEDKWTIATKDGSLSAQFEHTVLITDGPAEILTQ